MRNIIIVTNSFEISGYYIAKLKEVDPWIPEPEFAIGPATPDTYSRWVQVENYEAAEMKMEIHYDASYNILRIPYEGFAWTVAMNRTHFKDHSNIVLATSEMFPTPIYSNRLAQMMVQGKYIPTIEDIDKWFDDFHGTNILLDPMYDDIYNKFCNGQIPHTSTEYKYAYTPRQSSNTDD